jgi:hypothetical protein
MMKIRYAQCTLAVFASLIHSSAFANTSDKNKPINIITEWSAFGSGCRGGKDQANPNVMLDNKNLAGNDVHKLELHFDKYSLQSPISDSEPKRELQFASECAIRLAVTPPPGKKIKAVYARSSVMVNKSTNVRLTVQNLLYVGPRMIGKSVHEFQPGISVYNKQIDLDLKQGNKPEELFPELKCAEAKIVGVDYTFYAQRKEQADPVKVDFGGDKNLEIRLELESC